MFGVFHLHIIVWGKLIKVILTLIIHIWPKSKLNNLFNASLIYCKKVYVASKQINSL